MELYEFIFLVLGSISLIDLILTLITIYINREFYTLFDIKTEIIIKQYVEIVIIIITVSIFMYKFLF